MSARTTTSGSIVPRDVEELRHVPSVGIAVLGHGIFWSWNIVFMAFLLCGLVPEVLWSLFREARAGLIPWDLAATCLAIAVVPLVAVAFGARLRRSPRSLLALFYGLEAPIFLISLGRLFLVRQMTPGVAHLLAVFYVASVAFGCQLLLGDAGGSGRLRRWLGALQLAGQSFGLAGAFYLGGLLLFHAVPLAALLVRGFLSFQWVGWFGRLFSLPFSASAIVFVVGVLLFLYSTLLFLVSPLALIHLYWAAWRRMARAEALRHGVPRAIAISAAVLAVHVGLFFALQRQPQAAAFQRLEHPPRSDRERRELLAARDSIRDGLVNAWLAPYRYLGGTGDTNHIHSLYRSAIGGVAPGSLADALGGAVQRAFNAWAAPFLYRGSSMDEDHREAERRYEEFFDRPIQQGEKDEILDALAATWSADQREAGLLAQGERKVRLVRQEISVDERDGVGEVELHEVYENQTAARQEIFYYFNLPESAAVTGLWLGNGEARAERFAFVLAPRGAAQEVYRREVRRGRDPALLEQIGPRQYRLRVFPIPPRNPSPDSTAPPLHLWLTYRTFTVAGRWPLPRLGEQRNVYWDARTVRVLDGRRQDRVDGWMPTDPPASSSPRGAGEAVLAGGYRVRRISTATLPMAPLRGQRFAVIIDRSYSMNRVRSELIRSIDILQQQTVVDNRVDYFLSASAARGEPPVRLDDEAPDSESLILYGGEKTNDLLRQFEALREGRSYDAVFVLTDGGSFDLAADHGARIDAGAPVWMVHLGGRLPPGYDDATGDSLWRHGGGVGTGIEEVLRACALTRHGGVVVSLDGDFAWTLESTAEPESPVDRFTTLAARQLVLHRSRSAREGDLTALDLVHGIARSHGVVTPFSSMIVLIDDRQREELKAAEEGRDRFDREVEDGKEPLARPVSVLDVQGTPEPEEWLLILLVAAALAKAAMRLRQVQSRRLV